MAKFKFIDVDPAEQAITCSSSEHAALRALQAGNANSGQQQLALKWIVEKACGFYDLSYRGGADGARSTEFNEGRRFVGKQIITELKIVRKEGKPAT